MTCLGLHPSICVTKQQQQQQQQQQHQQQHQQEEEEENKKKKKKKKPHFILPVKDRFLEIVSLWGMRQQGKLPPHPQRSKENSWEMMKNLGGVFRWVYWCLSVSVLMVLADNGKKSCLHSVSVLLFSYPSSFQRIHHAKRFPIFLGTIN